MFAYGRKRTQRTSHDLPRQTDAVATKVLGQDVGVRGYTAVLVCGVLEGNDEAGRWGCHRTKYTGNGE